MSRREVHQVTGFVVYQGLGQNFRIAAPQAKGSVRGRKNISADASARHGRSGSLALTACSTSRRFPALAIPSCRLQLQSRRTSAPLCVRPVSTQFFYNARKVGPHGWCVIADWSTQLGIPKVWVSDSSSPRSLDNAYETVLALNRGFVTMPVEDQDLGIA